MGSMTKKHASLRVKIISGFIWVSVAITLLSLINAWGINRLKHHIEDIGGVRAPAVESVRQIQKELESIRVAQRTLLSPLLNPEDRARQFTNVEAVRARYRTISENFKNYLHDDIDRAAWQESQAAIQEWAQANDRFFLQAKELVAMDVTNPDGLLKSLEGFSADHADAVAKAAIHIIENKHYEGCSDPTQCRFGKWLATYKTSNKVIQAVLAGSVEPHNSFHAAVKEIKEALQVGDDAKAKIIFQEKMKPAADKTLGSFRDTISEANKAHVIYAEMAEYTMKGAREKQQAAFAALEKVAQDQSADMKQEATDANRSGELIVIATVVLSVVTVGAAIFVGVTLSGSLSKKLTNISQTMASASLQTAASAGQVASSSQALAEGTSEQAAGLEETSSSLEEMASMTKRNYEFTEEAKMVSNQTRQMADQGVLEMNEMEAAMQAIQQSSNDISKILKSIDEIAFQTNILALNAAVEAARAGEAGAGFAVVADEVRTLAQRAAMAAQETAAKIEDATKTSTQGAGICTKVSISLNKIVENARKLDHTISEIANASKEQTLGIEQINGAVGQMDKVVQSISAQSEESAAAAEELSAQAQELKVSSFELLQVINGSDGQIGSSGRGGDMRRPAVTEELKRSAATAKIPLPPTQTLSHTKTHQAQLPAQTKPTHGHDEWV